MFELISTGLTIAEKVFGAAERAKALNLSFTAILRSLYFEITANLRLLDVIDPAKLKPENLAALASALEIESCAAVLFSGDEANDKARQFLDKRGKVPESAEEASASGEAEDGAKGAKGQKTVLQALLFIIQRVIALQKIAAVYAGEKEESVLIKVRVPVRIRNIQDHLNLVKKKMLEFNKEQRFLFD